MCGPCSSRRGSKPCPALGAGSSRPLFKSPQGSRAAQPLQREVEGDGWSSRRGRVCGEPPRHLCYPALPPGPEGPNSWHRPPCFLGEEEGPLLLSLPLRGPGTTPMKRRHLRLPPAPGESRGAEAGRLARGPQASPAPSTFLAFLTSSWQQGALPSQPAPGPSLQPVRSWASFLRACVRLCVVG